MTARRITGRTRHLPRVPLPRQRGGAHVDKTRLPARKQKHKKNPRSEEVQGGPRRTAAALTPP